jgi:hypothetical protein
MLLGLPYQSNVLVRFIKKTWEGLKRCHAGHGPAYFRDHLSLTREFPKTRRRPVIE